MRPSASRMVRMSSVCSTTRRDIASLSLNFASDMGSFSEAIWLAWALNRFNEWLFGRPPGLTCRKRSCPPVQPSTGLLYRYGKQYEWKRLGQSLPVNTEPGMRVWIGDASDSKALTPNLEVRHESETVWLDPFCSVRWLFRAFE